MALSKNPTRTLGIEKKWMREINRRWREYTKSVTSELLRANRAPSSIIINRAADPFVLDPDQQISYMSFVESEVQRLLLVAETAPNWQANHQLQAYIQGMEDTTRALISQGVNLSAIPAAAIPASQFSATVSLAAGAASSLPVHQDALRFLFERSYTSLNKWTDDMSTKTRGILFTAAQDGKGINEVVREMRAAIDVTKSRAMTIARTEINQAYSRSALTEAERASEIIDEEVKMRWITARDVRVRHSHARVHGKVMSTQEASRIKTSDGVNCRCGLAPVIEIADTPKRTAKFKAERSELLRLRSGIDAE